MNDRVVGRPTSFRVVHLDEPRRWRVTDASSSAPVPSVVGDGGIEIQTTVDYHTLIVTPR